MHRSAEWMRKGVWLGLALLVGGLGGLVAAAEHGGTTMKEHGGTTMRQPGGTTMTEHAGAMMSGVLDGKIFDGEVGDKGKKKGDKDQFVFKDGTFRSTACDAYGFTATPYTTTAQGNAVMFEATAMSPTDGQMAWKGTVQGDAVEGTSVWTKSGQAPKDYWFKGTLKR